MCHWGKTLDRMFLPVKEGIMKNILNRPVRLIFLEDFRTNT